MSKWNDIIGHMAKYHCWQKALVIMCNKFVYVLLKCMGLHCSRLILSLAQSATEEELLELLKS